MQDRYEDDNELPERMALLQKGEAVFGSSNAFHCWMHKPAFGLNGEKPQNLLHEPGGISLIMDELTRIEFGDLA